MNQMQMMQQMRKMQTDMAKAQEDLAKTIVTGAAAGETVKIELFCDYRVNSVKIAKEAIDPDDVETLEDLVVVAMNDALKKIGETSAQRMSAVTGGLHIPGLM
ncbi:MAG: YbaB/EbfC family nucleoid-associated protein [Candidatus Eremiobacteraeota bacterium]|nr:YbaB/EbfC family nucleoid-associated protein [Candidatus Eremiobacteraeota bacterium]